CQLRRGCLYGDCNTQLTARNLEKEGEKDERRQGFLFRNQGRFARPFSPARTRRPIPPARYFRPPYNRVSVACYSDCAAYTPGAAVAKLAYAAGLKSAGDFPVVGSTPTSRTTSLYFS